MPVRAVVVLAQSDSDPDKKYQVWVGPDGPIFCDCPAHMKGKYARGKPAGERPFCKHMKRIAANPEAMEEIRKVLRGMPIPEPTFKVERPPAQVMAEVQHTPKRDPNLRIIEVQEETSPGKWVPVVDTGRGKNLEV